MPLPLPLLLLGLLVSPTPPLPGAAGTAPPAPRNEDDARWQGLRDLAETRNHTFGIPVDPVPLQGGEAVVFLRSGPRDPLLRLYERDLASGREVELLPPEAALAGASEELSAEEKARRERMRQTLKGFTSFALSRDGARVLAPLGGRVFVVDRASRTHVALPGEGWIDPRFSPDGTAVAGVRDGELRVVDLGTLAERALTRGATPTLTHAVAEFVAQEEMGRFEGYWWSPDGAAIAWQETDLTPVERLWIPDPGRPEAPPTEQRYPRAGTPNAVVRLGVVPAAGGETAWIDWDRGRWPYLARVVWDEPSAPLTLLVQARDQREEAVLAADPSTGRTRVLLVEADAAWLNLDDHSPIPKWLHGGRGFLWSTERRGGWQIELRAPDGALVRELTPVALGYRRLVDVDAARGVAFVIAGPDPREDHLYRVPLGGGEAVRLTREPGVHAARFARDHGAYALSSSLADGRALSRVVRRDGSPLGEIPSVAEPPGALPRVEVTRVEAGGRTFDAAVVRPRDFAPGRRHPVILYVYAGPTRKMVVNASRRWFHEQWMADQGYVVVTLDARGTPGHGREWERAVRGDLAGVALADQVEGLRALARTRTEMDLGRVAVVGWSFGGYFAAMAAARRPDVFQAAVAGAPVTEWRDYDTHYTERYLGLPGEDAAAYDRSSVLTWAAELRRPLLLIHGVTDDNVYFVHSLKLAEALFRAARPFELLPLSGTHQVADPDYKVRLWKRIMGFIAANVPAVIPSATPGGAPTPSTEGEP